MTNSEIKAVLVRALARLKDGAAWCRAVDDRDPKARSWCAIGAIYAELDWTTSRSFAEIRRALPSGVVGVNDAPGGSFEDVRVLYTRAIASLGENLDVEG